jgi:Na+-driven multidrug efflux pump
MHGAPLGAVALVGCIGVEALFVAFFARPYYVAQPTAQGVLPGYGEIGRFAWPVIANAILENGLVVVINGFVGRLADPDLSLAAFGVVRGLLMLMMSPLRNLAQTAQALARTEADLRVVKRFAALAGIAFTILIALLFYTPLRGVLLAEAMGLEPHLVRATEPAVLLFIFTPFLWAFASLYRGLLAGARRTGVLATTGLVRLGTVVAVSSVCLVLPQVNGAVVGVLAMAAAFASEMVLLRLSLHRHVVAGRAYRSDIPPAPEQEPGPGGAPAG